MPRYIPTRRGPQPRMVNREVIRGDLATNELDVDDVPVSYRTRGAGQFQNKNGPVGDFTGAHQPRPPRVFRKFGNNTRQLVGYKHTGLWDNQYETGVIESRPGSAFISSGAVLAQSGAPSILQGINALKAGPHHWLFKG